MKRKPIQINPDAELRSLIEAKAKREQRKLGPMCLWMIADYFRAEKDKRKG